MPPSNRSKDLCPPESTEKKQMQGRMVEKVVDLSGTDLKQLGTR